MFWSTLWKDQLYFYSIKIRFQSHQIAKQSEPESQPKKVVVAVVVIVVVVVVLVFVVLVVLVDIIVGHRNLTSRIGQNLCCCSCCCGCCCYFCRCCFCCCYHCRCHNLTSKLSQNWGRNSWVVVLFYFCCCCWLLLFFCCFFVDPRNLHLKFSHNRVSNTWEIADVEFLVVVVDGCGWWWFKVILNWVVVKLGLW